MQFDDEATFLRQLAKAPLPSVILIAGVEELRVIEAADAVRAKAREQGCERSIHDVDGRFDWDDLVADFSAMSLFASARLLDVRAPEGKLGKEGSDVIADFCKNPPPGITLLLTCMEWSKRLAESAWVKAIGKGGQVLAMWALPRHKLPDWLLARLRARGIDASHDAAELLAERVEGNLLAAAQEVDKLALLLHGSGEVLDVERMDALVADSARFDVFRLADAALNGQAAQVARIIAGLRAEGEAIQALMGMVVKELGTVAALAQARNFAAECKAQRIWDSKQAVYKRALARHSPERWQRFLSDAGRVDRISKGRVRLGQETTDAWQQLERLLLAVADKGALRLLAP